MIHPRKFYTVQMLVLLRTIQLLQVLTLQDSLTPGSLIITVSRAGLDSEGGDWGDRPL